MLNKCLHARIQLYSESRPAYIEVFYKKTTPPPPLKMNTNKQLPLPFPANTIRNYH